MNLSLTTLISFLQRIYRIARKNYFKLITQMNTSIYQCRIISRNSNIIVANLLISDISKSSAAHGMACATCMSWCSRWREIVRRKPITLNSSSGYTAVISRLAGAHTHAASATRITRCRWHDKADCNCDISIAILDCYLARIWPISLGGQLKF